MCSLRKLLPIAVAMAASVLSAPSAAAQTVEVTNETTGQHCSAFTMVSGQPVGATCTVRLVSASPFDFVMHNGTGEVIFGFPQCDSTLEMAIDENGDGYVYNASFSGQLCGGRTPCNLPWAIQVEESAPGAETVAMDFCLGTTPCPVVLDLNSIGHEHEIASPPFDGSYNGGAPCTNLNGVLELKAHWITQPNENHPDDIEIAHIEEGC
jgi:hypothetical protein